MIKNFARFDEKPWSISKDLDDLNKNLGGPDENLCRIP